MKFKLLAVLSLAAFAVTAAQQNIDFGTPAPGDGDTAPVAFGKIQANTTELYSNVSGLTTAVSLRQMLDADLTAIAGLTPANDDILQRKAGAWVARTPAQYKADLNFSLDDFGLDNVENVALSTWAGSTNLTTLGTVTTGTWAGGTIPLARGGTGAITAAAARTNLGLGNVQDTALSTWAGSANLVTLGTVATGTWNASPVGLLYGGTGATSAAGAKTNLGLGNVENVALSTYTGSASIATVGIVTAGTWRGVPVALLYGGTGATSAAGAKTNLGLDNVENVALSAYTGSVSIDTLGTVTDGTWNATPVGLLYGGTGATSAAGARTALGLGVVENTALSTWAGSANIATLGTVTSGTWAAGTIPVARGGTGAVTLSGLLKGNGTSPISSAGASDVTALFSGTCSGSTALLGDGSCGTLGGGGGAPTGAAYITQTPDATLSAEQALSGLATGLVKNTTATGVLSIGAAGVDYESPLTFGSGVSRASNAVSVDQSFSPTWTGVHTYTNAVPILQSAASIRNLYTETDAVTDGKLWEININAGVFRFGTRTDADGTGTPFLSVTRTATAVATLAFAANTYTSGSGSWTHGGTMLAGRFQPTSSTIGTNIPVVYSPGANRLAFGTGSARRGEFDAAGNFTHTQAIADASYALNVPTTGFSITIANNISTQLLNPAGTLASGTVVMPATPIDGQIIRLSASQTVTALTLSPNSGQTINNPPSMLTAGVGVSYIYVLASTTWYRLN